MMKLASATAHSVTWREVGHATLLEWQIQIGARAPGVRRRLQRKMDLLSLYSRSDTVWCGMFLLHISVLKHRSTRRVKRCFRASSVLRTVFSMAHGAEPSALGCIVHNSSRAFFLQYHCRTTSGQPRPQRKLEGAGFFSRIE